MVWNKKASKVQVFIITLCLLCCSVATIQSEELQVRAVNTTTNDFAATHFNKKLITRSKEPTCKEGNEKIPNGKTESKKCTDDSSCPPWFYCSPDTNSCKCGNNHHHIIKCNNQTMTSSVLDCYCVTTNDDKSRTFLGDCFYNCESKGDKGIFDPVYRTLPGDISALNVQMCDGLNRKGILCGQCNQSHFLPAYSFELKCVPCPEGKKNIWKYILIAYGPLTFFYFFVLFFKINANSSHLHGFVLFSQVVSLPAFSRIALKTVSNHPIAHVVMKVELALYGFSNLDFFRSVVPETICLQTDTLQTLALDYGIAVYPLVLIIISYVMIELHDRNFRIVVFIWRPFRFIFTFFRRNWDSRTSVIDAYATFFLLAYVKFLSVSFDILIPTRLYELNSNKITYVLYYDGSIEYFGKEHLPYAILALAVLLIFIILPTAVLLLYPFRWFQKFLNCFPIRWHILHTFVDSFQGCYKDGTEPGTRDCRWFAALFLLVRILGLIIYMGTLGSTYFEVSFLLLTMFVVVLVVVQPFKKEVAHYTKVNTVFLACIILLYGSISGMNIASVKAVIIRMSPFFYVFAVVCAIVPLLYMCCIAMHWLVSHRKWGKEFIQRLRAWRQGYNWWELEEDLENSLPDRIVNPRQYHEGNLSNFSIQSSDENLGQSFQSVSTY